MKTRNKVIHKNVSQDFKMLSFWESLKLHLSSNLIWCKICVFILSSCKQIFDKIRFEINSYKVSIRSNFKEKDIKEKFINGKMTFCGLKPTSSYEKFASLKCYHSYKVLNKKKISEKLTFKHKSDLMWSSMAFEVILNKRKKFCIHNISIHLNFYQYRFILKLLFYNDVSVYYLACHRTSIVLYCLPLFVATANGAQLNICASTFMAPSLQ